MPRTRPWWMVPGLYTASFFGCGMVVFGLLAFWQLLGAWHASTAVHNTYIHGFQVFGAGAVVFFNIAVFILLTVRAKCAMDTTYTNQ